MVDATDGVTAHAAALSLVGAIVVARSRRLRSKRGGGRR
jgi:hypothetical protein